MRNDLPETCFATLPGTGELIILKRGETGYSHSNWETGDKAQNAEIASHNNSRMGITPAQVEAMVVGSMCGFNVPGADPQMYFDHAQYIRSYELDLNGMIKVPDISFYSSIKGTLHQYQVAQSKVFYLEPSLLPKDLMGIRNDFIILPDMVQGKTLVPVTAEWSSNGMCSLGLEDGCSTFGKEVNAGYQIIAKVGVGPVEYALGEKDGKFPGFVTWERTPANDGDGSPNYYWGHYFDSREEAIQDFCGRASEKYKMLAEQRKPSIKAQLAAAKAAQAEKPAVQQRQSDKGAR